MKPLILLLAVASATSVGAPPAAARAKVIPKSITVLHSVSFDRQVAAFGTMLNSASRPMTIRECKSLVGAPNKYPLRLASSLSGDIPTEYKLDCIVAKYPSSALATIALGLRYDLVKSSGSIDAYNDFLHRYPHRAWHRRALGELWRIVRRVDHVRVYLDFAKRYPHSPHAKVAHLKAQYLFFGYAHGVNRASEYDAFIRLFPESPLVPAASKAALAVEMKLHKRCKGKLTYRCKMRARAMIEKYQNIRDSIPERVSADVSVADCVKFERAYKVLSLNYGRHTSVVNLRNVAALRKRLGVVVAVLKKVERSITKGVATIQKELRTTRRAMKKGMAEIVKSLKRVDRTLLQQTKILDRRLLAIERQVIKTNRLLRNQNALSKAILKNIKQLDQQLEITNSTLKRIDRRIQVNTRAVTTAVMLASARQLQVAKALLRTVKTGFQTRILQARQALNVHQSYYRADLSQNARYYAANLNGLSRITANQMVLNRTVQNGFHQTHHLQRMQIGATYSVNKSLRQLSRSRRRRGLFGKIFGAVTSLFSPISSVVFHAAKRIIPAVLGRRASNYVAGPVSLPLPSLKRFVSGVVSKFGISHQAPVRALVASQQRDRFETWMRAGLRVARALGVPPRGVSKLNRIVKATQRVIRWGIGSRKTKRMLRKAIHRGAEKLAFHILSRASKKVFGKRMNGKKWKTMKMAVGHVF